MLTPTSTDRSNLTRGYTIALVSAVVLSTTGIFIRHLTQTYHLPPLVLAFWRDVFVALTLLVALGKLRPALLQVSRHHLRYLCLYGLMLAIFNALLTFSVAMNGAAVSTVLVYCSAAFTALLGWWLLKEHLDLAKLLAIAICLGGCVLVSGALEPAAWRANLVGIFTGVLSGLGYAIYSLMGRSAAQRGLNPWTTLFYTFGIAAICLLLFHLALSGLLPGGSRSLAGGLLPALSARLAGLFWLGRSLPGWGALILLAAGPTVIGFGLYNVSLSYLPSSVANLIVMLETAFTAIIAYGLLGERLNGAQIGGGLMILAGVVCLRIYEGWRAGQIQAEPQRKTGAVFTEG